MQENYGAKAQHITLYRSAGVFRGSFHGPPPRDGSSQSAYAEIDALGGLVESALFETTLSKVQSEPRGRNQRGGRESGRVQRSSLNGLVRKLGRRVERDQKLRARDQNYTKKL